MADVAARAGVSGQTVSRVVNGSPRVDPATRSRVEAAMSELGYRPHRAARTLRTGRSQTIGLVVSTLATVGNSRMLQAVSDAAAARGLALVVVTVGAGVEDGVAGAFERLEDQGVDGAIVLNEATPLARAVTPPAGLRLVVVDAPARHRGASADGSRAGAAPGSGETRGIDTVQTIDTVPMIDSIDMVSTVQTDHAAGARIATEHLISLGHSRIRHLAGPAGSFAAAERERGWRAALVAAGLEAVEPVRGAWTSTTGYRAAAEIDDEATAVFCANDQMALGILRGLGERGVDVPGRISVVGFDDVADAGDYRPPLTTVRQDFDALGEAAVAALADGADGVAAVIPTRLIERKSTASPR
ncbi:LacI family DNA-binding transcriptional regulator [Microbacterium aquimaris]|uniref:LacI family DNA-binding transcriptional regulator n=1 Tax=Microbacterium aquimaris TaxID=459816 RepID=A0ABU5N4S0_9MICO|nr:LacI family DNA-binding transcriptional regulator [Microbacterium aquimaris]MDZ8161058.1 LacI family DNA-binding transcriptional regulator [Microbacterium aquimaris]